MGETKKSILPLLTFASDTRELNKIRNSLSKIEIASKEELLMIFNTVSREVEREILMDRTIVQEKHLNKSTMLKMIKIKIKKESLDWGKKKMDLFLSYMKRTIERLPTHFSAIRKEISTLLPEEYRSKEALILRQVIENIKSHEKSSFDQLVLVRFLEHCHDPLIFTTEVREKSLENKRKDKKEVKKGDKKEDKNDNRIENGIEKELADFPQEDMSKISSKVENGLLGIVYNKSKIRVLPRKYQLLALLLLIRINNLRTNIIANKERIERKIQFQADKKNYSGKKIRKLTTLHLNRWRSEKYLLYCLEDLYPKEDFQKDLNFIQAFLSKRRHSIIRLLQNKLNLEFTEKRSKIKITTISKNNARQENREKDMRPPPNSRDSKKENTPILRTSPNSKIAKKRINFNHPEIHALLMSVINNTITRKEFYSKIHDFIWCSLGDKEKRKRRPFNSFNIEKTQPMLIKVAKRMLADTPEKIEDLKCAFFQWDLVYNRSRERRSGTRELEKKEWIEKKRRQHQRFVKKNSNESHVKHGLKMNYSDTSLMNSRDKDKDKNKSKIGNKSKTGNKQKTELETKAQKDDKQEERTENKKTKTVLRNPFSLADFLLLNAMRQIHDRIKDIKKSWNILIAERELNKNEKVKEKKKQLYKVLRKKRKEIHKTLELIPDTFLLEEHVNDYKRELYLIADPYFNFKVFRNAFNNKKWGTNAKKKAPIMLLWLALLFFSGNVIYITIEHVPLLHPAMMVFFYITCILGTMIIAAIILFLHYTRPSPSPSKRES